MAIPKKFPVHSRSGGLGHGKGGHLVIPNLPRESNPESVGDWATVSFGPGVDYVSSNMAPRLYRSEVLLKEHACVGYWGVDVLP